MNTNNKYKFLFFISLILNLILILLLLKPLPKEEQNVLDIYRNFIKDSSTVLPETKSNEIKHVSNIIIRKLSNSWDLETVKQLFNPNVLNKIGEEKTDNILKMYSKLGQFKEQLLPESVETVPGQNNIMLYATNVKFEAGNAYVRLVLEKIEGEWYINNININSEVFLNQLKEK